MATQEKKCGLCVDAGTVRERYTLVECVMLILFLPGALLMGTVFVSILPQGIIAGLVLSGSLCLLFLVVSYFLICHLGRAITGTYLYHFKDADGAFHCHKHDYGNGKEDKWRRTQGAKDGEYLREAVGGWLKKSAVFRNGKEVEWFCVESAGISGLFHVDRKSIRLAYLEPEQVLLAANLLPSTSQLLLFRLLQGKDLLGTAVDATRKNVLLNQALDAQGLRLASTIDYAIGQKRGGRESQAVAGIREKLESMLEELPTVQLETLHDRIQENAQGEWDASKERLLGIIQARLNQRAEAVDEPLPPLPDAVAEQPTAP